MNDTSRTQEKAAKGNSESYRADYEDREIRKVWMSLFGGAAVAAGSIPLNGLASSFMLAVGNSGLAAALAPAASGFGAALGGGVLAGLVAVSAHRMLSGSRELKDLQSEQDEYGIWNKAMGKLKSGVTGNLKERLQYGQNKAADCEIKIKEKKQAIKRVALFSMVALPIATVALIGFSVMSARYGATGALAGLKMLAANLADKTPALIGSVAAVRAATLLTSWKDLNYLKQERSLHQLDAKMTGVELKHRKREMLEARQQKQAERGMGQDMSKRVEADLGSELVAESVAEVPVPSMVARAPIDGMVIRQGELAQDQVSQPSRTHEDDGFGVKS